MFCERDTCIATRHMGTEQVRAVQHTIARVGQAATICHDTCGLMLDEETFCSSISQHLGLQIPKVYDSPFMSRCMQSILCTIHCGFWKCLTCFINFWHFNNVSISQWQMYTILSLHGEYNDYGFVEISRIFAMQLFLFFDRVYHEQMNMRDRPNFKIVLTWNFSCSIHIYEWLCQTNGECWLGRV